MSFSQTNGRCGEYETISITSGSDVSITIIPEMGARLNSFLVPTPRGLFDVIDGYKDGVELATEYYSKSSLLAPFPNRIADGSYSFAGEHYQLPINKVDEHNTIHGFISDKKFLVTQAGESTEGYEIVMEHESLPVVGFPFPFRVKVSYFLSHGARLSITTELKNIGFNPLPAGFGWHPYFSLGLPINQLLVSFPELNELIVDHRLIPTGEFKKCQARHRHVIAGEYFDTGFQLLEGRMVELINPETLMSLQLTCGEGFDYLQVFTPPWRTAIAFEPMTCAANAFNNGFGLRVLAPGEKSVATFTVQVITG